MGFLLVRVKTTVSGPPKDGQPVATLALDAGTVRVLLRRLRALLARQAMH